MCARFGLECVVYMGEEDIARQALNVFRMRLMGATVVPVESGTRTLKDATNEAIRDWVTNVPTRTTSSARWWDRDRIPRMVRDFQAIIGREARAQVLARYGRLPQTVVACVGGGSNAMGIFTRFVDDADVELVGVEAAGEGLEQRAHCASLSAARPACCTAPQLPAAGRGRPGASGALRLGGAGLPGRGPGALLSEGQRPRELRVGHRRRGAGRHSRP